MRHQLRIPVTALVLCVLCQPFPMFSASGGDLRSSGMEERFVALAQQLETLQGQHGAPAAKAVLASGSSASVSETQAPDMRTNAAMIADALGALIEEQRQVQDVKTPDSRKDDKAFLMVDEQSPLLPRLQELSLMAIETINEQGGVQGAEENEAVSAEASTDLEDADAETEVMEAVPSEPPLPPMPRVQTTPEVHDANVEMLREIQRLKNEKEAEGDTVESVPTATVKETGVVFHAPAPVQVKMDSGQDPWDQLVSFDFRDTNITNIVALVRDTVGANIIAGAGFQGLVTANIQMVPLRHAVETVLRINGWGMIEEDGIYFIVPYDQAASINRKTAIVALENAMAEDVKVVLEDLMKGVRDEAVVNISVNRTANVLIISAPKARTDELIAMAHQLDVAEPVLPTITEAISLNYSEPQDILPLIEKMLTEKLGQAAADKRARHLVVTDMPVVIEQVKELVKKLDVPTQQVLIETMVVDAILADEADTGIQWLINSLHRMSRREAAKGEDGRSIGNIQDLSLLTDMPVLRDPGSLLTFSVLTDKIDWTGLIQMEIRNRNGRLVSNPVLLTLENSPAEISISQEIPYTELTQTGAGGQQTSTRFKEVGTVLSVTPRVTHDKTIICTIEGKESTTTGTFQGVPIEDKREISSTMRMGNGQTIFIGGLRKSDGNSSVKKVPVLGDVPIINFMFRQSQRKEQINDLLVFLTCTVIDENYPKLTPEQQEIVDTAPPVVPHVNAWETLMYDTRNPHTTKDMQMRWRRGT